MNSDLKQMKQVPDLFGFMWGSLCILAVTKPQILTDMHRSKLSTKGPIMRNIYKPILGKSVNLSESSADQKKKRQLLAGAFFQSNVLKMVDSFKELIQQKMEELAEKYTRQTQTGANKEFNIVDEINDLYTKITFNYVFGLNMPKASIKIFENGVEVEKDFGEVISYLYAFCFDRTCTFEFFLHPNLNSSYLRKEGKEFEQNCAITRKFIADLMKQRRKEMDLEPSLERYDLLSFILSDECYKSKDGEAVGGVVSSFLAGFLPAAVSNVNLIFFIANNYGGVYDKVRAEIKEKVLDPYYQSSPRSQESSQLLDFRKVFNKDVAGDLEYLSMCYHESMRIESTATTSMCRFNQDITVGGYNIKKETPIMIYVCAIHHNLEEWISPELYIPERFSPKSPFFLTPSGSKRNPHSFSTFISGPRMCVAKAFTELLAKMVMTALFMNFNIELLKMDDISIKDLYAQHAAKGGNNKEGVVDPTITRDEKALFIMQNKPNFNGGRMTMPELYVELASI